MDKIAVSAYVDAKHNMNMIQCRDAVAMQQTKVALAAGLLADEKSVLAGFKKAMAEKKEALG